MYVCVNIYVINLTNLPVGKPVLERLKTSEIPSNRLGNNPVQPESNLRHEHANPSPYPCRRIVMIVIKISSTNDSWDVFQSVKPYQTYPRHDCARKHPISSSKLRFFRLKQN